MTSHSELAASTSHRWMACPGSVIASRGVPTPETVYAAEGTTAHEVASTCLVEGSDADQFAGQELEGIRVTPAMVTAVQIYLDVCRRLMDSSDIHLIEHAFDLAALHPPVPNVRHRRLRRVF